LAILMQAGVPGMTDGLAAGIGTTEFPDRIRSFTGFGWFFCQGPVDGGWLITEANSEEEHAKWIEEVILPSMASELMSTVAITLTPLTQVEIS